MTNTKFNSIIDSIYSAGGRVFYVGGFVRDAILGRENKDIDIEIHGISLSETQEILSRYGKVDLVGSSFGVLKVSGMDVDFTFPRKERLVGGKHTDFEVTVDPFMPLHEAARRRDFTMNAIMEDVKTGERFDFFGGINDIEEGVIRVVDNSTFIEDVLRPLRACQFAARFNMDLDENLIRLAQTLDYTTLSKERVTDEIEKAFKSSTPSVAFNNLLEIGVIRQLFPELQDLVGCPQNPEYHPEGDVWNHTMTVIDMAAKLKEFTKNPTAFMYFALLHDIGKPATTEINKHGNWSAIGHETVGAEMIPGVLGRFTKEKTNVDYVQKMTAVHMKAHHLGKMKASKVRVLASEIDFEELLLFMVCDNSLPWETLAEIFEVAKYNEIRERCLEFMDDDSFEITPIYTGKMLIEMGVEPGPEMGKLLKEIFQVQLTQVSGNPEDHLERFVKNKIKKMK